MAMEFDKEMDALLKRMSAFGERPGGRAEPHLDAEEIAAFAENVIPGSVRTRYITHFADCGRCRTILADAIALNAAEPAVSAAAPSVVTAGAVVRETPWYRKLFSVPKLAYGMAGLIVMFGGLIAYTALFNMQGGDTQVSQVQREESSPVAAEPTETPVSMADSLANIAVPSQAGPEEKPGGPLTSALDQPEREIASARSHRGPNAGRTDVRSAEELSRIERDLALIEPAAGPPPAKQIPPPPPVPVEEIVVAEAAPAPIADATREQLAARQQAANVSTNVQNQSGPSFRNERAQRDEDRARTSAVTEAQKARVAERRAAKRSVPQDDAPQRRTVSGKSFELRGGVWFDAAYRGEATVNVQRGSEDYQKLESGLRRIAQRFSEPVVAVWKGKAYRIQ